MALTRDARLLARARRGEQAAFERIYARHQAALLSFCRHLTGSREDAEDAVQHVFLAAYRTVVEAGEEVELRPWLFTVARNRCLSLLRARREAAAVEAEAVPALDGLAAEVERRQELRDLLRDLARLPEPQRAALVLSQLDALSHGEIATVLGVAPAKVKALVFQARTTLMSMRVARETPCQEIRLEIANARGAALRRRLLRGHVRECAGCREFETAVLRQRRDLDALLPVTPSAGLAPALGGALAREGAGGAAGIGGAATAGGGGLAGTLAAIGAQGAAKLAVVAVLAGGAAGGAMAADLPVRLPGAVGLGGAERGGVDPAERRADTGAEGPAAPGGAADGAPARGGDAQRRDAEGRDADGGRVEDGHGGVGSGPADTERDPSVGVGEDGQGASAAGGGSGVDTSLPPGLAKRDELPPGLAKRDELPPGLAKRDGGAPGKSGADGNANGQGNGNGGRGAANGNAANGNGQGNGGGQAGGGSPPAAPGNGDGGNGAANGKGQGNGNGNGAANGGGNGNGGGGNGKGNGSGKPH